MKKNYKTIRKTIGLFAVAIALATSSRAQISYTFTSAGVTGPTPPTQAQINTAYSSTNLSNSVTVTNGIQAFTIPTTGPYRIIAIGAQGGYSGGPGAYMSGDFNFTAGTVLNILVGQTGTQASNLAPNASGGGGGGSFITGPSPGLVPYVVAGGGGGDATGYASDVSFTCTGYVPGMEGSITTSGNSEPNNSTLAGTNGNGGITCGTYNSGGGGGFYGDGASCNAGSAALSYTNGGAAGLSSGNTAGSGGFGGGGGCYDSGTGERGGGGGGYSGGAGGFGYQLSSPEPCSAPGGGGGSYNNGANQTNSVSALGLGDGKVILELLCDIHITASGSNSLNPVICAGSTVTLTTNGVSGFNWSNGNTTTNKIVVAPLVTTNYTLSATSSSGCVSSAAITVSVNTTATVTATRSSSAVCAGKSVTLTGNGATTYTWVAASGSVTNAVGFTPSATGNYTVKGSNACNTASAITSVTVNPLPNIGASVNNPTVCNGSNVIFNGSGSASGYTWTSGVTNNATYTPGSTGNYTVTGASAQGCTNTAVVGVTIYITPNIPPVLSSTAICVGKTATISSIGATGYTWNVTPPAYTSSIAVTPAITSTYVLTRSNGACTSTANVVLVVNNLPNLFVSAPVPSVACPGTSISFAANGAVTYTWYVPGSPLGFPGGSQVFYPNATSQYTVVASNANCTISAVSAVTINPLPVINVASSASVVCAGTPITFTASGASTYTWSQAPFSNSANITDTPLNSAIYNVDGTNSYGCVGTGSELILVNAAPIVTVSIKNPGNYICAGQAGSLVAVSNAPTPTYSWSTGATTSSISVNPPVTTVYVVTATNPTTSCKSVNTLTLSVYISTFVVTAPQAFCKGQSATLTANGPASSYSWSTAGAGNTPSIVVTPISNTNYYVTGITGNCSSTQTINVIVNQPPSLALSLSKTTICRFEPGHIKTNGSSSTYSWSTTETTSSITITPTVTTTYAVTGTDLNGCTTTATITQYVSACLGIEQVSGNLNELLSIYPNPSNGEFTIQADAAMHVRVVNETGQLVKQVSLTDSSKQLSIYNLANGIYFIIAEKDGNTITKKVVVNK